MPNELQQRRAEILLVARKQHGLTQGQLADLADVSRSLIQNYENPDYEAQPQRGPMLLICRVLDLDPDATMQGRYGDDVIREERGLTMQAWLERLGGWLSRLPPTDRAREMGRIEARMELLDEEVPTRAEAAVVTQTVAADPDESGAAAEPEPDAAAP